MSTVPPGAGRDELLVAKTLFGLEGVLADELRMLGAKEVKTVPRAVTFVGDLGFIYKCNLMLTTALKVLRPIHQFGVLSKEDLYRGSLQVPWTDWFSPNSTFVVRCSGQHPAFTHSGFAALVVKDAIADSFRKIHGIRPSVGKENPDIVIDVRLTPNRAHLSMDSSGHSLHRRGYRQEVGAAPMSEVLAAGILRLAGYRGDMPLLDPMCGSGTFPIEAAIQADRLPPGLFRDRFAFQSWSDYSEDLHAKIEESVLKKGRESLAPIFGWDREAYMLVKAQKNAEAATLEDRIQWKRQTFIGSEKPTERGLMLVNPPYNVKIQADTDALYRGMAETLAKGYSGWEAWILSADREALRRAGWDIFKRIPLKNGDLDCDLVGVRLG
jgi:putative N6-adenine-specific DNA methylase